MKRGARIPRRAERPRYSSRLIDREPDKAPRQYATRHSL